MTWIENIHFANWNQSLCLSLAAYVLGCVTGGYYLTRLRTGKDLREIGSGSVGARNASRVLGKSGFLLTALFDFAKGAAAISLARHFTLDERVVAAAGIAVVAGHVWPVQLRFRGGKGMATLLGALLAFDPKLAAVFAGIFACLWALSQKTILPGLVALVCVPLAGKFLDRPLPEIVSLSAQVAIVLFAHRKNISEQLSEWLQHPDDQTKPDHPL